MENNEINANTEEELLVQISHLVKEMTTKKKLYFNGKENGMWETTFWIDGVQTGEPLVTSSLDDNTKFIEGIIWGLRNVMKLEHVETRIKYKDN
jgi:hypothetical protein